jgi:glycosyltransferase involved in cell wall biosynthesis
MRSLTIVIPTYNEAKNLASLTTDLWALPIPDLKVLIVDDGSPDGTGELAEDDRSGGEGFRGGGSGVRARVLRSVDWVD